MPREQQRIHQSYSFYLKKSSMTSSVNLHLTHLFCISSRGSSKWCRVGAQKVTAVAPIHLLTLTPSSRDSLQFVNSDFEHERNESSGQGNLNIRPHRRLNKAASSRRRYARAFHAVPLQNPPANTQRDGNVIFFHVGSSWYSPPSCG